MIPWIRGPDPYQNFMEPQHWIHIILNCYLRLEVDCYDAYVIFFRSSGSGNTGNGCWLSSGSGSASWQSSGSGNGNASQLKCGNGFFRYCCFRKSRVMHGIEVTGFYNIVRCTMLYELSKMFSFDLKLFLFLDLFLSLLRS
jgi:hypothetical protein